jgi:hypothetical protein
MGTVRIMRLAVNVAVQDDVSVAGVLDALHDGLDGMDPYPLERHVYVLGVTEGSSDPPPHDEAGWETLLEEAKRGVRR